MDWSQSPDVEIRPGFVSGAFVVRGARVRAQAIIDNVEDGFTTEQIVTKIYEGLPLDRVAFAVPSKFMTSSPPVSWGGRLFQMAS